MMKKIYLIPIFLLTLFISCNSTSKVVQQNKDKILYFLPIDVEKELKLYLENNEDIQKNVSFEIRRYGEEFTIFTSKPDNYWRKVTNRHVVINKKLYPLFFDYDFFFGTAESSEKALKKLMTVSDRSEFARKVVYNHYYNVFNIKFTKKGKILYKGFE